MNLRLQLTKIRLSAPAIRRTSILLQQSQTIRGRAWIISNHKHHKQLIKQDGFSFLAWLTGPLKRDDSTTQLRVWLQYPGFIEACSTLLVGALRHDPTTANLRLFLSRMWGNWHSHISDRKMYVLSTGKSKAPMAFHSYEER